MHLTALQRLSYDLATIKAAQGSLAKRDLAAKWKTPEHLTFLDMVGNNKQVFFITWDAVMKAQPLDDGSEWDDLWREAALRVATTAITAGRIKHLLAQGYPENVLKAIVDKTLDAGITVKEVNKARGEIKPFAIALANAWFDIPEDKRQAVLTEHPYCSTTKLDGLRCLFILIPGQTCVLSRQMKPLKNLDAHMAALLGMFEGVPCLIDGEIMAEDWSKSVTATKKAGSTIGSHFYPFDFIPAEEYLTGNYTMLKAERIKTLHRHMDFTNPLFRKVHFNRVFTPAQVSRLLDEHVSKGYEGSVLHQMDVTYRPNLKKAENRTPALLKVKLWLSAEFRVIGIIEGRGKHAGRMGSLLVEGPWVNGKTGETLSIRSEVGGGFTDAEREAIWRDQPGWHNALVEVKFFEATPADRDGISSLRFPSYCRRRVDLEE